MMTLEEITQIIQARLSDDTGQATMDMLAEPLCVYRTNNGKKCVVGCLIKDEHYHSGIEETSVRNLHIDNANGWGGDTVRSKSLAKALNASGVPATKEVRLYLLHAQEAHDDDANWKGNIFTGVMPS